MLMLQKMHEHMVLQGEDGPPLITANAVDFDGTNDYLNRGGPLTIQGDYPTGILSFWVRLDSVAATGCIITNLSGNNVYVRHNGSRFLVSLYSAGGAQSFDFQSVSTFSAGPIWRHVLASWNTNFSAGNKIAQLYINDALETSIASDSSAAFNVGMSAASEWYIGSLNPSLFLLNGCLSELYFAPQQFLDFSVVSNRRKFISPGGKPVSLGSGGIAPTGTPPSIYLNGTAAAFGNNGGTGGNFTINGTLDPASTSPSD